MEPKFTPQMLKNISLFEPQKAVEMINMHFEHLHLARLGRCDHVPSELVVKASGDMAERCDGSFCIYCSREIVIARIEWKLKAV